MKEVDFKSLQVENINYSDYPDFCDAYICGGSFVDGEPLDDVTIEKLNQDNDAIYEAVQRYIY
jgi:hypothetical protein